MARHVIFVLRKRKQSQYCWVMKLADMPSCLGGEEPGTNPVKRLSVGTGLPVVDRSRPVPSKQDGNQTNLLV